MVSLAPRPCRIGRLLAESALGVIGSSVFASPKTSAVKRKRSASGLLPRARGSPALKQTCSRNVARSHFSSTGTCGSSSPHVALADEQAIVPTRISLRSITRRIGESTEISYSSAAQFAGRDRTEARILQRRERGHVAHVIAQRLERRHVADAAAQLARAP